MAQFSPSAFGDVVHQKINPATQHILLVDDRDENLLTLKRVLARPNLTILTATSGHKALSLLLDHPVALILMDVLMPEMDGFETAELIRGNPETCRIPIIFVTAVQPDTQHIFKGYHAGAVDYLSKPLNAEALIQKVKVFLELHQYQQSLLATTREFTKTVETLKAANIQIQAQQKKLVEEERLKALLQMAGAMAHELSQPLMALQGNIQLMKIHSEAPEKVPMYISRIDDSGRRIAETIRKIQTLHVDVTRSYAGDVSIINLDQTIRVLVVGKDGDKAARLMQALTALYRLEVTTVPDSREAISALRIATYDLVFISHHLPGGQEETLIQALTTPVKRPPFIIISHQTDDLTNSRLIRRGAFEIVERSHLSRNLIRGHIHRALDTVVINTTHSVKDTVEASQRKDPCTGLYARDFFDHCLQREVSRARSMGKGLALLLLTVDSYGDVLDTYGAKAGAMVLESLGNLIGDTTRAEDTAAYFDTATFAILISDITATELPGVTQRFIEAIGNKEFVYNAFRFNLTLRAGTGLVAHGAADNAKDLVRDALESLASCPPHSGPA